MRQLVTLLTGRERDLVKRIVHPYDGIIAKTRNGGVPTLKEVTEWLATTPYGGPMSITHRKQPEPEPEMSAEERERCDAMWAEVKPLLREASEKMRVNMKYDGVKRLDWSAAQVDDEKLRTEALVNLRQMEGE